MLVSFAPGLFWLWFYLRKDIYRPAPQRLIAITFGLGCLSTIPAAIVQFILLGDLPLEEGLHGGTATAMLVVGIVEELCKFAVVRFKPYRSPYFDEPMDGLVYAAAASLGFASLENAVYVLQFGPEVMIIRAPVSTLAHLVYGSIWGYALGVHLMSGYNKPVLVVVGIGLAAGIHALFNVLLLEELLALGAIALAIAGGVWAFGRFKWGQQVSPFKLRRNYPKVVCYSCGQQIRVTSRFCRFCGASVTLESGQLFCGHCGEGNRPDASYCTSCGDRLLQA